MIIGHLQSADWSTDKSLLRWFCTDCPPALHPLIVTLFGSPPKLWIYFWTHLNASCWSWKAKFGYCPLYQKPNGPIHLTFVKLNLTSELEKALARQISYFIPRKSKIFEYQKTFILFDSASKVSSHLSGVRI